MPLFGKPPHPERFIMEKTNNDYVACNIVGNNSRFDRVFARIKFGTPRYCFELVQVLFG